MANLKEAVIVSACRTAIGELLGSLKSVSMTDMAAICLKEAVDRVGLENAACECYEAVATEYRALFGEYPLNLAPAVA